MSRTRHSRPLRTRTSPTISAKKPDEGRRWMRRFLRSHDVMPIRDQRKLVGGDEGGTE